MELPLEIQHHILTSDNETLIKANKINKELRQLTENEYVKYFCEKKLNIVTINKCLDIITQYPSFAYLITSVNRCIGYLYRYENKYLVDKLIMTEKHDKINWQHYEQSVSEVDYTIKQHKNMELDLITHYNILTKKLIYVDKIKIKRRLQKRFDDVFRKYYGTLKLDVYLILCAKILRIRIGGIQCRKMYELIKDHFNRM